MDELSDVDRRTISRYLALDEALLYSLIPPHLAEHGGHLFSPEGQEEAGRNFFARIKGRLRKAICKDFDWPAKKDDPAFNDPVTLVATIADVISGLTFNVPPFMVATLVVKQGLTRLCSSYDDDGDDTETDES